MCGLINCGSIYDWIEYEGIRWPCPDADHPVTPLFVLATANNLTLAVID
jgi:hypothetical protein